MKSCQKHLRRSLIFLVWLSLAARVVVPQGFMPADSGEGLPIKFCPGVVHGTHDAGEAHDGDPVAGEESEESSGNHTPCPLGLLFASGFLGETFEVPTVSITEAANLSAPSFGTPAQAYAAGPRPRGPPLRIFS